MTSRWSAAAGANFKLSAAAANDFSPACVHPSDFESAAAIYPNAVPAIPASAAASTAPFSAAANAFPGS